MSTDGYSDRTDEEKQKEKIQGADLMISCLHCFDWQVSAAWCVQPSTKSNTYEGSKASSTRRQ